MTTLEIIATLAGAGYTKAEIASLVSIQPQPQPQIVQPQVQALPVQQTIPVQQTVPVQQTAPVQMQTAPVQNQTDINTLAQAIMQAGRTIDVPPQNKSWDNLNNHFSSLLGGDDYGQNFGATQRGEGPAGTVYNQPAAGNQ